MSLISKIVFALSFIASSVLGALGAMLYLKAVATLTLSTVAIAVAIGLGVTFITACCLLGLFFILAVTYCSFVDR